MTDIIKRFREKFGAVDPKYIAGDFEGREFCAMCGSPTKVDKVYQELEAFITAELKAQRKEIIEEIEKFTCTPEHKDDHFCGFNDGLQTCSCYNEALEKVISHLKTKE